MNELQTQATLFPIEIVPQEIQKLKNHGAPLSNQDLQDFSKAQYKIFKVMRDGQWHTASEIIAASGIRSGLRMMRTFRDKGWKVNKTKQKEQSREWMYQLIR